MPGPERRALLRAHYRFECACERCAPEVEAEERARAALTSAHAEAEGDAKNGGGDVIFLLPGNC